jgi:hypothetical protein
MNARHLTLITNLRYNISDPKGILIVNNMSQPTKIKLAILVLLGALFTPIAAQAGVPGIFTSTGTVTIMGGACPTMAESATSVSAQSVLLIIDTLTVANDVSTYYYYTETNTALWGAGYDYGAKMDAACIKQWMTGNVTISRGPFIASAGAQYSETSTVGANAEFVQYVGNTSIGGGIFYDSANNCGNLTVPNLNVANSCDFNDLNKQAEWPILSTGQSLVWRTNLFSSGISPIKNGVVTTKYHPAVAFVVVKALKTKIDSAPLYTSWVATETFTVTSQ